MGSEKKRILKNTIIYACKQIFSVLFPLISFAYSSRVLGVEKIGEFNYARSITDYFVILSGLGISTYAIRAGAKIRDKKEKINSFVSELFVINIISTIISLFLYLLLIFNFSNLNDYKTILIYFSLLIPFTTLGIEWIYNIYEDFLYITVRSAIVQILSFVLLVIFVKNESDIVKYVLITIIATVGSNIFNLIHAKKYFRFKWRNLNIKQHFKPILFLFGMTIATTLYTTMDTTMLGYLCNDYYVGLYSAAHKITKMLVLVIATIRTVSLPVLSRQSDKDESTFIETSNDLLSTVLMIAIPIVIGVFEFGNVILLIMSGNDYLPAKNILNYLSIDILFSATSGALVYQYVLLKKGEKYTFIITFIGALSNLVLNYIFIMFLKGEGAAIATCISEVIVLSIAFAYSKKYIIIKKCIYSLIIALIGSIPIAMLKIITDINFGANIIANIFAIICCIILYFIIITLIGNNVLAKIVRKLIKR